MELPHWEEKACKFSGVLKGREKEKAKHARGGGGQKRSSKSPDEWEKAIQWGPTGGGAKIQPRRRKKLENKKRRGTALKESWKIAREVPRGPPSRAHFYVGKRNPSRGGRRKRRKGGRLGTWTK